MRNKYIFRGRISEHQFRQIIKYFALDLEASKIAILTKISRPSINRILLAIRERIAALCEDDSPCKGDIEVDESYFGGRRKKACVEEGLMENCLFLVYLKGKEKSIPKLSTIARKLLFKP